MTDYSNSLSHAIYMKKVYDILRASESFFSEKYSSLTDEGAIEVMLYCMASGNMDTTILDEIAKALWHSTDGIWYSEEQAQIFCKGRAAFYKKEKKKLALDPMYTPMRIYNTFFLNPLKDDTNDLSDFNGDFLQMMLFDLALKELDAFVKQKIKEEL